MLAPQPRRAQTSPTIVVGPSRESLVCSTISRDSVQTPSGSHRFPTTQTEATMATGKRTSPSSTRTTALLTTWRNLCLSATRETSGSCWMCELLNLLALSMSWSCFHAVLVITWEIRIMVTGIILPSSTRLTTKSTTILTAWSPTSTIRTRSGYVHACTPLTQVLAHINTTCTLLRSDCTIDCYHMLSTAFTW